MNEPTLNLRDIHLPEPISWWPIAPGWWLIAASIAFVIVVFFLSRKIYRSRQLKRDIHTELDAIKQTFQKTENSAQLARALSVLLRRASISFYPAENIAGLTGENWLAYLDATNAKSIKTSSIKAKRFQSDAGKTLLTAPYLPDDTQLEFDPQALIALCEAWLLSAHTKSSGIKAS